MTSKLNELATLCGKNNVELTLTKSETISIDYLSEEKKLIITFTDFMDDKFKKLLDTKIEELKELFK